MNDGMAADLCATCRGLPPTAPGIVDAEGASPPAARECPPTTGLVLESRTALAVRQAPERAKILCVDDDRLIRQMIGDALERHGFAVLAAADGWSALQLATRERPALILLDVLMPGMDGFEICLRLKDDPQLRSIPVVLLTATADERADALACAVGAAAVVSKSASPSEVVWAVAAALASWTAGVGQDGAAAPGGACDARPALSDATPADPIDLAIPVRRARVTVTTADGAQMVGSVFVGLQASGHTGPETVQDRLNDACRFLTLATPAEAAPVFVNKEHVVRVEFPASVEDGPDGPSVGLDGSDPVPVRVHLSTGELVHGTVRVEGPIGKRRLSDFLNADRPFLCMENADRVYLLHRRHIARVALEDPARPSSAPMPPHRG
jgi:CheY-like chemotaxis protein